MKQLQAVREASRGSQLLLQLQKGSSAATPQPGSFLLLGSCGGEDRCCEEAVSHLAAFVFPGHVVEHSSVVNEGVQLPAGKEAKLPPRRWSQRAGAGGGGRGRAHTTAVRKQTCTLQRSFHAAALLPRRRSSQAAILHLQTLQQRHGKISNLGSAAPHREGTEGARKQGGMEESEEEEDWLYGE